MRKQFLDVPVQDSVRDQQMRAKIEETHRRFDALSEEDQILHLLSRRMGGVREYSTTYEKQMEHARDFIEMTYGPRFAERILSDPAALKKLHLDPDSFKPSQPGTTTVVVG